MLSHLTPPERETIVNADDDIDTVTIWTAQRKVITALRKKAPRVTEVRSGFYGSSEWAEFSIAASDVSWGGLVKTRRPGQRPPVRSVTSLPKGA